jgi:hypothetical protein
MSESSAEPMVHPASEAWPVTAAVLHGIARELTDRLGAAGLAIHADPVARVGGLVGVGLLVLLTAAGEELRGRVPGDRGPLSGLLGVILGWGERYAAAHCEGQPADPSCAGPCGPHLTVDLARRA